MITTTDSLSLVPIRWTCTTYSAPSERFIRPCHATGHWVRPTEILVRKGTQAGRLDSVNLRAIVQKRWSHQIKASDSQTKNGTAWRREPYIKNNSVLQNMHAHIVHRTRDEQRGSAKGRTKQLCWVRWNHGNWNTSDMQQGTAAWKKISCSAPCRARGDRVVKGDSD